MTADTPPSIDRLFALLADRAVGPLTPAEAAELAALQAQWPHVADDALDLAAAAADIALSLPADGLPPGLRDRILAAAPDHLPITRPRARANPLAWVGWAVAACLAVAVVGTYPLRQIGLTPAVVAARPTAATFPAKTGAGEVVWDTPSQQGFLTVRGLPPNDPAKERYQLWIVDAARTDPKHAQPVDGGLFDVGPDGSATVPVRAALPVRQAAAFAVTREGPDGVVVSAGPHLAVFAR
jgi:hypothetical protein